MYQGRYTQSELPPELFHVGSGETRTYGGITYRIDNNGDGTRTVTPVSGESGGGGGGGGEKPPAFNFDWTKAREESFNALTPYYSQKIKDAKGDVELAKKYIEEDYQRGIRYAGEDYTRAIRTTEEDLSSQLRSFGIESAEETRESQALANRRGVFAGQIPLGEQTSKAPESSYYGQYVGKPLSERQELRKQAIERAVGRQQEVAGIEKTRTTEKEGIAKARGFEQKNIEFPRMQAEFEEQKRQQAFNIATPLKYQEEYAKYRGVNRLG